jgi:hypothetical protein
MGEMVLRERKNLSRKGPLEILGMEIRSGEVEKKDYPESGFCHSEEQGDEESSNKRFFTEFTLRSFTPFRMTLRGVYPERSPEPNMVRGAANGLRVTHDPGFRMTTKRLIFQVALGRCHPECDEGSSPRTTLHSNPPISDSPTQSMLSFCFATTP